MKRLAVFRDLGSKPEELGFTKTLLHQVLSVPRLGLSHGSIAAFKDVATIALSMLSILESIVCDLDGNSTDTM